MEKNTECDSAKIVQKPRKREMPFQAWSRKEQAMPIHTPQARPQAHLD